MYAILWSRLDSYCCGFDGCLSDREQKQIRLSDNDDREPELDDRWIYDRQFGIDPWQYGVLFATRSRLA